ncbi:MAG: sensor histidine kinase [Candidatus Binatia bacterium]
MNEPKDNEQLAALATYLAGRRDAILKKWRQLVASDAELTSASALSRAQFYNHIPAVLDAFERELRALQSGETVEAREEQREGAADHGLHRWHHGYNQQEVMREWSHLHFCLSDELEEYVSALAKPESGFMLLVRQALARLFSNGIIESASRYARLQQLEAAARVHDLEQALAQLQELERSRAETWREAAHDLRGNLGVVKNVTQVLNYKDAPEPVRSEYLDMLQKGVDSLHALLDDLIILSRLEAGHEQRKIAAFDVGALLQELCAAMKPLASDGELFLEVEGPESLVVQGDAVKIRRIAQNLLLNAIKYTERGGLKVSWAEVETEGLRRWSLTVQDTGPGLKNGQVTPLARALKKSTEEAQEVEKQAQEAGSTSTHGEPAGTLPSQSAHRPEDQHPGEGIGLSIVRRLCELLDASLELETERGRGSTFRIIFPHRYDNT